MDELELEERFELMEQAVDTCFLLVCAIFVFLMQFGFAALEVGSIRPKNTKAVLLKNTTDAAIGALVWWLVGHGVAFGEGSGFIGENQFAFSPELDEERIGEVALEYARWMLQWAFAATSTTIVSGAIAERVALHAYLIYGVIITSLIYPVVAHWVWAPSGWASSFRANDEDLLVGCGVADFSGSGVVHLTGGLMALVAAFCVHPRGGRFDAEGKPRRLERQSPALNVLGTLILWAGWFFFNASGVASFSRQPDDAAKSMLNTAVCPSAAVVVTMLIHWMYHRSFDPFMATNGMLGGLVAITASSPLVQAEGAFVIGVVSGALVFYGSKLLIKFKIDDVVDASVVHGLCGLWGMVATGLFTTKLGYARAYAEDRADECCGVFYGCSGSLLAANVIFVLAQLAWVGGTAVVLFLGIKYSLGLRVNTITEEEGMDKTRHGGYHGGATTMGSTPGAAMEAVRRLSGTDQRQSAVVLASTSSVLA
ncbi:unnamed protein product [Ectocarpus sp. 12 AP-2014]